MRLVPIFQKPAFKFIKEHHRHHKQPRGSVFQIGLKDDDGKLIGVVVCGRPVSRKLQDGYTLEVIRLCVTESKNSCSMLYSAAARAARELGYKKIITYILQSETGVSLMATGWTNMGVKGGGSWDVPSRRRKDKHPIEKKIRFERSI